MTPRAPILPLVLATILAACSQQPGERQQAAGTATQDSPAVPVGDADAQRSAYLAAAEPFENLTEQAPSASAQKLATLIKGVDDAAAAIGPKLAGQDKQAFDKVMADIDSAKKAGDTPGIALAAVEGYRWLVEHAADTGPVPRDVSLLDYAGFRYQADLAASPVRWEDAGAALAIAREHWTAIESRITDAGLHAEFAASLDAMASAADAKDPTAAKSAVTRELDLVDKLEIYFGE